MLPPHPHNIILFELYFNIKFHLLRLIQFLSDLKCTITRTFIGYTNHETLTFVLIEQLSSYSNII